MTQAKLLLDTNIVIDFLDKRDYDFESTRTIMVAGKAGEFSLWISASQATDLVYILSEGGKANLMPGALERLRRLRSFVGVYALTAAQIDEMLQACWPDPEDALLYEVARAIHADAIITRNANDFEQDAIKVCNSSEFLEWMESERGLSYAEIPW